MQLPELFGNGISVFAVHDEACDGNGRDVDAVFLERLEDALRQRAEYRPSPMLRENNPGAAEGRSHRL